MDLLRNNGIGREGRRKVDDRAGAGSGKLEQKQVEKKGREAGLSCELDSSGLARDRREEKRREAKRVGWMDGSHLGLQLIQQFSPLESAAATQ